MSAEIIELWAKKPIVRCSFCGCTEKQATRMFANGVPGKESRQICDRCLFEARLRIRDLSKEVQP